MKPRRYGPFPYSPIIERPKQRWPNGARIAVWLIPNIEFFALDEQVPAAAGGGGKVPDIPSWTVRDYGNRIGVFRIMDVLDRYKMRGTVALNSELCAEHPQIIRECIKRDWEHKAEAMRTMRGRHTDDDAPACTLFSTSASAEPPLEAWHIREAFTELQAEHALLDTGRSTAGPAGGLRRTQVFVI